MSTEKAQPGGAFEEVGSQKKSQIRGFSERFFGKLDCEFERGIGDYALNAGYWFGRQIVDAGCTICQAVVSDVRCDHSKACRLKWTHDCAITRCRFPNEVRKVGSFDAQQAEYRFRWAKICIETAICMMMTALKSHDLFPRRVSDTRPGFTLRRLPISACDRSGCAAFIAVISFRKAAVIGAEVTGALCPLGRRPISSASSFSSSQANSRASCRSLSATSGSLIALLPDCLRLTDAWSPTIGQVLSGPGSGSV